MATQMGKQLNEKRFEKKRTFGEEVDFEKMRSGHLRKSGLLRNVDFREKKPFDKSRHLRKNDF